MTVLHPGKTRGLVGVSVHRKEDYEPLTGRAVYNGDELPSFVKPLSRGKASGMGAGLTVQCNLTVAESSALFSFPEIHHDLPPTIVLSYLPNYLPPRPGDWLTRRWQRARCSPQRSPQPGRSPRTAPWH